MASAEAQGMQSLVCGQAIQGQDGLGGCARQRRGARLEAWTHVAPAGHPADTAHQPATQPATRPSRQTAASRLVSTQSCAATAQPTNHARVHPPACASTMGVSKYRSTM